MVLDIFEGIGLVCFFLYFGPALYTNRQDWLDWLRGIGSTRWDHQHLPRHVPAAQPIYGPKTESDAAVETLEETMDPFIARYVYNKRNPLLQLPDEILIKVMECIDEDPAELFIIRLVCRRLRHLANGPAFRYHVLSCHKPCQCPGEECICHPVEVSHDRLNTPATIANHGPARLDIRHRLRRDQLCWHCTQEVKKTEPISMCKFKNASTGRIRECGICPNWHPTNLFSAAHNVFRYPYKDICIGRTGCVRLCEHESITWHHVSTALKRCKEQMSGTDERAVPIVACKHLDHQTTCISRGKGPEAWIYYTPVDGNYRIDLLLEVHSGYDRFVSYNPSRGFNLSELRAQFHEQRQQGAEFLCHQAFPGDCPEMNLLVEDVCNCYYYQDDNETNDTRESRPCRKGHCPLEDDVDGNDHGKGQFTCLSICSFHQGKNKTNTPCLKTVYWASIYGNSSPSEANPSPPHDWLHEMDRTSYSWAGSKWGKENCDNPGCPNSYPLLDRCQCDLTSYLNVQRSPS